MLDQNTDRMWYVIGAIVIGAAIIAMGLNIFDESFDSVEDSYASVIGIANSNINDIGQKRNLITPDSLILGFSDEIVDTVDSFELPVFNATDISKNPLAGVILNWRVLPFKVGYRYHMSFSYRKIGGNLISFGGHSPIGVNVSNIKVDGEPRDSFLGNDDSLYVDDDFETHTVSFDITVSEDYKPRGVGINNESSLWLQPNRRVRSDVLVLFEGLRLEYIDGY